MFLCCFSFPLEHFYLLRVSALPWLPLLISILIQWDVLSAVFEPSPTHAVPQQAGFKERNSLFPVLPCLDS